MPLLDHNYSNIFDQSCNQHSHYLDTMIRGLDVIKVGENTETEEDDNNIISVFKKNNKFTALDGDLFGSRG